MNSNAQCQAPGFAQEMTLGKGRAGRARSRTKRTTPLLSVAMWRGPADANAAGDTGGRKRKRRLEGRLYRIDQALVRDQPMAAGSSPPRPKVIAQMMANTAKFP